MRVHAGTYIPGAVSLSRDGTELALDIHNTQTARALHLLHTSSAVHTVETDTTLQWTSLTERANGTPNDPLLSSEWALDQIGWHYAPSVTSTPAIAFLDSGLDTSHPDMLGQLPDGRGKVAATYNAIDGSAVVTDQLGHGTATASIASATTNNGIGLASVSPDSQIAEIKVGGMDGVDMATAVRGLNWAVTSGYRVINMSFGTDVPSAMLAHAVANAAAHGVVLVAAAGNDGCARDGGGNDPEYPAALPDVITVGASNSQGHIACFSNYGPEVDLVAPGVNLALGAPLGNEPDTMQTASGYQTGSGTSFAAPIVAAAAADLLAQHPTWTPEQVRWALMSTATDIGPRGWDPEAGAGILDLPRLLSLRTSPPRDSYEPNNDIAATRHQRVMLAARAHAASKRFHATLDGNDDPIDVYRVQLHRGERFTAAVHSRSHVNVRIWQPGSRSVTIRGKARRARSKSSGRRNRISITAQRSGTYYVELSTGLDQVNYSATLTAAKPHKHRR